ncbi:AraC family transcriptional regulator [uncultured Vibrio sp.]|uniref:AraC family transcriptional regulator n=1 Tax=uncultured Vibrio sp. TaxID=114054 RepID=UPI0025E5F170|nr:AraC family transcriptional regulator [uncultured Vibrio sp.]
MVSDQLPRYVLPAIYLVPAVQVCADKCIDFKNVLMRAGLSPNILSHPNDPIDQVAFVRALNEGAKASRDELFGFLVGKDLHLHNLGTVGALVAAQTCIANIYPVISYLFNTQHRGARHYLSMTESTAYHNIKYLIEDEVECHQVAQVTLMGYHNVFKNTLGDVWKPTRILMKNPKPIDTSRMEVVCGCPVVTGADRNAIEFPRSLVYLEREVEQIDELAQKKELANVLLECEGPDRLVGNYIEFSLADGQFDKETIAQRLGIHPRVLQNCLNARGLDYKTILQSVRQTKACTLLKDTHFSVSDISSQLGFSEPRVFSRAFKNWMSMTPLQYRKMIRKSD